MGFGFQRIIDFSDLSLKQLNDQLQSLWGKVTGGIEIRDMSGDMQETLLINDSSKNHIADEKDGL